MVLGWRRVAGLAHFARPSYRFSGMPEPKPSVPRFLSREARGATEFLEDVTIFLELPDDVRTSLIAAFRSGPDEGSVEVDENAFEDAFGRARKAGLRWLDVYQALRAVQWFSQALAEQGDEQLVEMLDGAGNDDRTRRIEALLAEVKVKATLDRVRIARRAAQVGVVPAFMAIHATEELRAVFVGADGGDPELVGLEPVVSLRLDLDSGNPASLSFQATLDNLRNLIETLERVTANLEALQGLAHAKGLGNDATAQTTDGAGG
jgi:hypothetical protein